MNYQHRAYIVGQLNLQDPGCIRLVHIGIYSSGALGLTGALNGNMWVDFVPVPGVSFHEAALAAERYLAQHHLFAGLTHLMDNRTRRAVRALHVLGTLPVPEGCPAHKAAVSYVRAYHAGYADAMNNCMLVDVNGYSGKEGYIDGYSARFDEVRRLAGLKREAEQATAMEGK